MNKQIEQIATEKYPIEIETDSSGVKYDSNYKNRESFIDGFHHAQSQQPMWTEIDVNKIYSTVIARCNSYCEVFQEEVSGRYLLDYGFTHCLTSQELLNLPFKMSPEQIREIKIKSIIGF